MKDSIIKEIHYPNTSWLERKLERTKQYLETLKSKLLLRYEEVVPETSKERVYYLYYYINSSFPKIKADTLKVRICCTYETIERLSKRIESIKKK